MSTARIRREYIPPSLGHREPVPANRLTARLSRVGQVGREGLITLVPSDRIYPDLPDSSGLLKPARPRCRPRAAGRQPSR